MMEDQRNCSKSRIIEAGKNAQSLEEELKSCKKELTTEKIASKRIYKELIDLAFEKERDDTKNQISSSHLDTKNRLLKEVLTKRNKDIDDIEKGNKQLVTILEKYDEKLEKLKQEI